MDDMLFLTLFVFNNMKVGLEGKWDKCPPISEMIERYLVKTSRYNILENSKLKLFFIHKDNFETS